MISQTCPHCYKSTESAYERVKFCGHCGKSFISAFTTSPTTASAPSAPAKPALQPNKPIMGYQSVRQRQKQAEIDQESYDGGDAELDYSELKFSIATDEGRKFTFKDLMNTSPEALPGPRAPGNASVQEIEKQREYTRSNKPVDVGGIG